MINISKIEEFADKLFSSLSNDLTYHNRKHTSDVRAAAKRLGELEKLSEKEMKLLDIAALFHDIGHVETYEGHEDVSKNFIVSNAECFGLENEDTSLIVSMIEATKLPQNPENHLSMILCDADLDNLGRDDFLDVFEKIFIETQKYGPVLSKHEWCFQTIKMMKNHSYFTLSAKKLRYDMKIKNIKLLEDMLNE